MKSAGLLSVLALTAFTVWTKPALARSYLNCPSKKVVIIDAPKGTTSSSAEENFGFWIDEATKIVTLGDGKKLNVRRFDDSWISAASGDVSYWPLLIHRILPTFLRLPISPTHILL